MRIGTQNVLFIVPLFLGIALLVSAMFYVIENQERIWGQNQQASSYAIAIAEFVNERMGDSPDKSNYSPAVDPGLVRALDRILGDKRVQAVFALSPDCKTVAWSYPDGVVKTVPGTTPPNLQSTMSHDGYWTSEIMPSGRHAAMVLAYSSMITDKKLVGTIGVITDASEYIRQIQSVRTGVALAALGVIAMGLLVTLLVSSLISREVRNLSTTAAQIAGGDLDVQAKPGHIQEIGDLANTFNTMSDVLKDILSRTKRSMAAGDQLRTPTELAASYVDCFRTPLSAVEIDGVHVASGVAGQDFGAFWTAVDSPNGVCIALGLIAAGDEIDQAISASAASRFLTHRLAESNPNEALAEAARLFQSEHLECLRIARGSAERWIVADGTPTVQSIAADRTRWVLYRFHPDASAIVDRYVEMFQSHTADELVQDILAALPSGSRGALVVIAK